MVSFAERNGLECGFCSLDDLRRRNIQQSRILVTNYIRTERHHHSQRHTHHHGLWVIPMQYGQPF